MKRLFAIGLLLAATHSQAKTPELVLVDKTVWFHLLLKHPTPDYPYEARSRLITGKGVFILRFDYETGRLRQVHIYKSSGNKDLDFAAVSALKKWQAKPRSLHDVVVPITWTTRGARRV